MPRHAIDETLRSRNSSAIGPGRCTVIFEPQAVGDLAQLNANHSDSRSADETRSPFVNPGGGNKTGEKIVDSRVTSSSDPADSQLLATPFDGEDFPLARPTWIDNGMLKQLYCFRLWAKKPGKIATAAPSSIKMAGGSASVEEMIRTTEREILVTRRWYLREVDPRTILYAGCDA